MPTLNKVFLLGNLTRDPDLRGLPSGQSVCEMRMAITRRYISNGKEVDETCFVDVVVWGKSANNCKQFLTKGSQIMVEGRLQLDQWEDRNGGGQRSKLRVVAEQVQFMTRRSPEGGSTYPPREGGYAPQNSYGAPQNSYGPRDNGYPNGGYIPRDNSYAPRDNGYEPRDNGGSYGRPESGYDSYTRSVNPPPMEEAMPPMPPQGDEGDGNGMVDDIPF
ncbi:MAG: single-stranded DNA-binding protein [Lentisphaeria bacterium]|nr:single-stranded DNA-binding protein [Lentisphaeria bacterium]